MNTVTIPKKITGGMELVVIPREEYETLKTIGTLREFTPTPAQKRALARARKNRVRGNTLTLDELRQKLGFRG